MMMRMIAAAGIEPLTDGRRPPDEDNPLGYAELEAVKRTRQDPSWLAAAPGKAVKVIHVLLKDLPPTFQYRLVMMERDLEEVLESQRKMLERAGSREPPVPRETLRRVYAAQIQGIAQWLHARPNFRVLTVSYNRVLLDPVAQAARVAEFLGHPDRAPVMAAAVEPSLYRNRNSNP